MIKHHNFKIEKINKVIMGYGIGLWKKTLKKLSLEIHKLLVEKVTYESFEIMIHDNHFILLDYCLD